MALEKGYPRKRRSYRLLLNYNNIDKKRVNLLTLSDLSIAFGSDNYQVRLINLINRRTDAFRFSGYLGTRTQLIRVDKSISSKQPVTFGVP